jgi:diguanylate cyclase (GGDEF)-like protein
LGGDEFVVVLSGVRSLADAQKVAEKLVAASKQPYEVFGGTVHVGASVGVAHGIEPGEGWEALVDRADRGLYKAKRAGRGQIG